MEPSVFRKAALRPRSLLQRWFSQYPQENAVIEINNVLASKPVSAVTPADIDDIERRHAIAARTEFGLNMEEFYAVLLHYYARTSQIADVQENELRHLRTVLLLNERSVNELHARIGPLSYERAARHMIAGGQLSRANKEQLLKLRRFLWLPQADAQRIWDGEAEASVIGAAKKIIASGSFSPAQEAELEQLKTDLELHRPLPNDFVVKLSRLKLYWQLEHLPLPTVHCALPLQSAEVCHIHIANVGWHETRAVRTGSHSTQVMQLLDTGSLYLTNKRLVFHGRQKNHVIKTDAMLSFSVRGNAVTISKLSGKNPMLKLPGQADVFEIMLRRVLRGW